MDSVQNYGVTVEDEMYKSDALRLLSFVNWDDSSVSREALVSAGFYHAGEGRLRCAWCGGELARTRRLGTLGDPLDVHLRYFPGCSHAEMLTARDEAARSARLGAPLAPPGPAPAASPPPPPVALTEASVYNSRLLSRPSRALGVVGAAARHPRRAALAARLATFARWPRDRAQPPLSLAEAGFYYTGEEDQVRCFYCDGGLGRWEPGDAPWREHARWFPHCGYLQLVKGQEFVERHREDAPVGESELTVDGVLASRRLPSSQQQLFTVSEQQLTEHMEGAPALAALAAGLDVARVRGALLRRLRATGVPYSSSDALIDAALDSQLSDEAWGSPRAHRRNNNRFFWDDRPTSEYSNTSPPRSPSPPLPPSPPPRPPELEGHVTPTVTPKVRVRSKSPSAERQSVSLEEENRQLKEARMCKVCMDSEVSVVFLPCGHLVACASCGAGLRACPLCRAAVRALVRAYLA